MIKKLPLLISTSLLVSHYSFAQTTYLDKGDEINHVVERMEAKSGTLITTVNLSQQPSSRKEVTKYLYDYAHNANVYGSGLSIIDAHTIERAVSISGEWVTTGEGLSGFKQTKKSILNCIYPTTTDFFNVDKEDFFLSVNPVLNTIAFIDNNATDDKLKYMNLRGVKLRGRIANKIGFYTFLGDNQEKALGYANEYANYYGAVPGNDYAAKTGNNYDMFVGRGYIDFNIFQEHTNVTFGYDHNFIGNGFRSLVLSDFGAPSTFLRLRSTWGKFTYENLFLSLITNQQTPNDNLKHKKYGVIHQLNYAPTSWLSLGIFESTMGSQSDKLNGNLLIPVIGYQSVRNLSGSNDNTMIGFQFKALPIRDVQLYGQVIVDNLDLKGDNDYKHQYGLQIGAKYFDVANIKQLDVQLEYNLVSPFTYSAITDSVNSYTHYGLPMAHPLGNNFGELMGEIKYQPYKKWYLSLKGMYTSKSFDQANSGSLGNNIIIPQTNRNGSTFSYLNGDIRKSQYINLDINYELIPNLFLTGGMIYLRQTINNDAYTTISTPSIYGGLRWNMTKRSFDYFR